jgi:hypothetical protein
LSELRWLSDLRPPPFSHVIINEIIQDLFLEKLTNVSVLIKESLGWTKTGLSEEKSSSNAAAAVIERCRYRTLGIGPVRRVLPMLVGQEDSSCSSKQLLIDAAGSGRQQLLFQAAAMLLVQKDSSCSSKQLLIDAAGSGRQQLLFQAAAYVFWRLLLLVQRAYVPVHFRQAVLSHLPQSFPVLL